MKLCREEGLTVLVSSHHLHQVQQICDRVGLFISGKLIAEGEITALSNQLFSSEPYLIEAMITTSSKEGKASNSSDVITKLSDIFKTISGVISVKYKDNIFSIGCSRDITSDIARTIIESGAGLNYLVNKEYGLDDIYNRYFEGGDKHE